MEIYYVNSKGEKIYFDRLPYLMLTDTNVFNYEWSYDIKNNNLYNIRRSLPTKDVSIVITGKDYAEYKKNILYLYETLDTDAINQTFGRLYFGDYYLQCFCAVSDKPDKYIETKRTTVKLTLVANDTTWVKEEITNYKWNEQETDPNGKGYPYDFSYDYKSSGGYTQVFNSDSFGDSDVIITIYGYARYPEISIGDIVYQLNYIVQEGEVCYINTKEKTIRLRKTDGTVLNLFRYRSTTYYMFSKVPTGKQPIYWNGNFNLSITLLSERGEPKWT